MRVEKPSPVQLKGAITFLNEIELAIDATIENNEYNRFFQWLAWEFHKVQYEIRHIVMSCRVLIDNACDPDKDYLSHTPLYIQLIEAYNKRRELFHAASEYDREMNDDIYD